MIDCITRMVFRGRYLPALLVSLCWSAGQARAEAPGAVKGQVEFNRDIRPILSDNCFHCHGPDKAKRKGGLRLDTEQDGRKSVTAGQPDKSELFARIISEETSERMPPIKSGRKLTPKQVEQIRLWIQQGAKWQPHWAFMTPQRPPLPALGQTNQHWIRNPIDAFVLERLQREGLTPAPEADKTALIRRVTLDLTGLPPTLDEVERALNDKSTDWYEKVVDRLLNSPRYGERMVLEWLDAARYADSNGYQQDRSRTMWHWRDWVIDALNRNMPFDQFTIEQLAGDLLPNATLSQKIATGFNRNHMLNGEGGRIAEESRVDYVVDRVDTVTTVWLGLTFGCARCHDHKYDPFSQKDYYQVFANFNSIAETGSVDRGGSANPVISLPSPEQSAKLTRLNETVKELEKQIKIHEGIVRKPRPETVLQSSVALVNGSALAAAALSIPGQPLSERQGLQKKLADARKAVEDLNKSLPLAMVMEERPQPRETFVLIRGAYDKFGDKVSPGIPAGLAPLPKDAPANRLGFARWLVDPANPLTARVAVNRYWQTFFGAGLVKTTEDFGVQGELPSHPELLDWLAVEFMKPSDDRVKPWDVKALQRLIVTSATYRQSSKQTSLLRERDPDNRMLARGPRHRLSSFVIRDQALALAGLLTEKIGGPPVKPYQPAGIWEEMSFGRIKYDQDKGADLYRRSLYIFWRRTVGPTTMFDTSARQVCTVKPSRTNTPLQSLILMNDVTYVEAARAFAQRLMTQAASPDERVVLAFRLAAARPPSDLERKILTQSFERLLRQYQANPEAAAKLVSVGESPRNPKLDVAELAAYTGLASIVLNLDEVISKE